MGIEVVCVDEGEAEDRVAAHRRLAQLRVIGRAAREDLQAVGARQREVRLPVAVEVEVPHHAVARELRALADRRRAAVRHHAPGNVAHRPEPEALPCTCRRPGPGAPAPPPGVCAAAVAHSERLSAYSGRRDPAVGQPGGKGEAGRGDGEIEPPVAVEVRHGHVGAERRGRRRRAAPRR